MDKKIKIGTRGSQLALWQANWVKTEIEKNNSDIYVALEIIKTKGDKILDVLLAKVGGKGLFVKEIEDALLKKKIDLAIHSMKDMPAKLPEGLCIGAIPERETPGDVLISKDNIALLELKKNATVGTSSLRRSSQLFNFRPDLKIVPLRGNIDTRIKKLKAGEMDAIILAAAGIKRLGFEKEISEYIDHDVMLPAVGQGALCIEIRKNDPVITPIVEKLDHHETQIAVLGERAFLRRLEGSCQIPIAAHGTVKNHMVTIKGLVAALDGSTKIIETAEGPEKKSEEIGVTLANRLLEKGAGKILEKVLSNAE